MSKPLVKYVCQSCGYTSLRWIGKCPDCSAWNSFVEEVVPAADKRKISSRTSKSGDIKFDNLSKLSDIDIKTESRLMTNIGELDRVLGGGIVPGSVILIGGDPGIGKSTLMMQISDKIKTTKILYVSGEESQKQIKLRCTRLGFEHDDFYVLSETNPEMIAAVVDKVQPEI